MIQNLRIQSVGLWPTPAGIMALIFATAGNMIPELKVEVPAIDFLQYVEPEEPPCRLKWWTDLGEAGRKGIAADYIQAHYTEEDFGVRVK